jgi:hypothetical protein
MSRKSSFTTSRQQTGRCFELQPASKGTGTAGWSAGCPGSSKRLSCPRGRA